MLLVGTQPLRSQHPPLTALQPATATNRPPPAPPTPLAGSKPPGEEGREDRSSRKEATLSGSAAAGGRGTCVFLRLRGGTEREQTVGNVPLASPPSRLFLTRPHCVLLLRRLSHPGPHQTAALAFLKMDLLFIFLLNAENDSDLHTASRFLSAPQFLGQVDD